MGQDAIARVLGARSHYAVLSLDEPQDSSSIVPVAAVRRSYKALVLQVHPDKNHGSSSAAEAFKRLSTGYECLGDERLQREYAALRRARKPSIPRAPKAKKTRKRPPPPPPPPEPASTTAIPRPARTPEEVWSAFLREEEESARREFIAKGFDRDYQRVDSKRTAMRHTSAVTTEELDREALLNAVVDDHAREWKSWKRARVGDESSTSSERKGDSSAGFCCMLCRRKFPTEAARARHELLSELHKSNVNRLGI